MAAPKKGKYPYAAIAAVTLVIACIAILGGASAQTFNPQQPPDFGNFNGTRPDFGGNMSFPSGEGFPGGMGPGGDFNGTFPGRGDGNFSRPDFSGAPNQFDSNGGVSPQAVSGSQTDYTLIIAAVIVVVGIVGVTVAVLARKRKNGKSVTPPPVGTETFDF